MNILLVDDVSLALHTLEGVVRGEAPAATVAGFTSPRQALAYAGQNRIDVAFLDIEMADMSGLELAKRLTAIYPRTNIIFVTGFADYATEAFGLHASGYLQKPVEPQRVARELKNLRYPVKPAGRVQAVCFGSFEVFVDGKLLSITYRKAKELLAYLVHKNGTSTTTAEVAAVLWEDKAYDRALQMRTQKVISQLMRIVRQAGIESLIHKSWNHIAINTGELTCDYYDYLAGKPGALDAFSGEYMGAYSWAEETAGRLSMEQLAQREGQNQ